MKIQIEEVALQIQEALEKPFLESIDGIQSIVQTLGRNPEFQDQLRKNAQALSKGLELFRNDFILIAYSEHQGKYRIPHDHGRAWVIYVVVSGEVEMGNYIKELNSEGGSKLSLKTKEILSPGDARIYQRGEIHDTRCISESATILRLTSHDLKVEEQTGFMKRYEM